ncbi:5692_t:CDS:2, partial [Gigaspora rosea]
FNCSVGYCAQAKVFGATQVSNYQENPEDSFRKPTYENKYDK